MGNLGGMEILVIFIVALMVLGPTKLPAAARQVGRAVNELRRVSGGFQKELRDAFEEPMQETQAMMRGEVTGPTAPAASAPPAAPPAEPAAHPPTDTSDPGATDDADRD